MTCPVPDPVVLSYKNHKGQTKYVKLGKIFRIYCKIINYYVSKNKSLIVYLPVIGFYYIPMFSVGLYYHFLEGSKRSSNEVKIVVFSSKSRILREIFNHLLFQVTGYYLSNFVRTIEFTNKLSKINGTSHAIVVDLANFSIHQLKNFIQFTNNLKIPIVFVSSFFNQEIYSIIRDRLDVAFFGIHPKVLREFIDSEGKEVFISRGGLAEIPIELITRDLSEKVKIHLVANEDINAEIYRCWKHYYYIKEEYKFNEKYMEFLLVYKYTLQYISWLYLQFDLVEVYSSPYSNIRSIEEIFDSLNSIASRFDDSILKAALIDLNRLRNKIESGKISEFSNLIKELTKTGEKILILTHSIQEVEALKEFLSRLFNCKEDELKSSKNIYVHYIKSILDIEGTFDWAVFPSFLKHSNKAFSLICSPLIRRAIFILYPIEYSYYFKIFSSFIENWNQLTLFESLGQFTEKEKLARYKTKVPRIELFETGTNLTKLYESWEKIIDDVIADIDTRQYYKKFEYQRVPIKIRKVLFQLENGSEIVCEENERLDVLKDNFSIETKPAAEIQLGERIIIYDMDYRKTRFQILIEKLRKKPEYKKYAKFIDVWRIRLRESLEGKDLNLVVSELRKKGSRIKDAHTIYAWKQGYVMGPRDGEDVRRIGEVLGDKVLVSLWQDIANSLRKIRGLNIKAGKVLSDTIRQMYEGIFVDYTEKKIDKKAGITLAEIAENIEVLKVDSKNIL